MNVRNAVLRSIGAMQDNDRPKSTSDEYREELSRLSHDQGLSPNYGGRKGLGDDLSQRRKHVVNTCRDMADGDPRVDAILDRLSRDVAQRFTVIPKPSDNSGDAELEDVIGAMNERFAYKRLLRMWLYDTYRDGDLFIECGIAEEDGKRNIVELSQKPTLCMERKSDDYDLFPDPAHAFCQRPTSSGPNPLSVYGRKNEDDEKLVWYPQFLIEHVRHNQSGNNRYGRSLMASARGVYNKMKDGELQAALRRASDTGTTFVHYAPGARQEQIDEYMERNKRVLNDQLALVRDIFSNQDIGSVQRFQGNSNLGQMGDVEHHVSTFFTRSPVPKTLIGYGENINRDIFEFELACYFDYVADEQEWVADALIKPIYHKEMLLNGILPAHNPIDVLWIKSDKASPETLKSVADFILKFQASQLFDDDSLIDLVVRYVPGVDRKALLAHMEELRAIDFDAVGRLGELARLR